LLFGRSNTGDTARIRRDIAWLAGDMELYGTLTGWQYIRLVGQISESWSRKRAKELAEQLEANLDRKIHALSRGNRQKVGLIAALARNTKLLIFDEPTSGLDPLIQRQFRDLMYEYRKGGGTVFISSHMLSEVQTLCDRVAFIREGKIVDAGALPKLLSNVPKRVTIKASKEVLQKIAKAYDTKTFDGHIQFDVTGNPGPVLATLPLDKIDDITVSPPELEEIFMTFYEGRDEGVEL
jgi:ABC-2 type transport system ATP-binding protein